MYVYTHMFRFAERVPHTVWTCLWCNARDGVVQVIQVFHQVCGMHYSPANSQAISLSPEPRLSTTSSLEEGPAQLSPSIETVMLSINGLDDLTTGLEYSSVWNGPRTPPSLSAAPPILWDGPPKQPPQPASLPHEQPSSPTEAGESTAEAHTPTAQLGPARMLLIGCLIHVAKTPAVSAAPHHQHHQQDQHHNQQQAMVMAHQAMNLQRKQWNPQGPLQMHCQPMAAANQKEREERRLTKRSRRNNEKQQQTPTVKPTQLQQQQTAKPRHNWKQQKVQDNACQHN